MENEEIYELEDDMFEQGLLTDVSDKTIQQAPDGVLNLHLVCSLGHIMTEELHDALTKYHNTLTELSAPTPELMEQFLVDHLNEESTTWLFETQRFSDVAAELRRRRGA